jgi:divalent metal cation (Fe/Co/Zn/Cd) transporter
VNQTISVESKKYVRNKGVKNYRHSILSFIRRFIFRDSFKSYQHHKPETTILRVIISLVSIAVMVWLMNVKKASVKN